MISKMSLLKPPLKWFNAACSASSLPNEMKAWEIHKFADSSKSLTDELRLTTTRRLPPLTSSNHMLVRVETCSLNPIDAQMLKGFGANFFRFFRLVDGSLRFPMDYKFPSEFPLTPGRDFCGSIVCSGPNAVKQGLVPGESVLGANMPHVSSLGGGTLAEFVLCSTKHIARKPSTVDPITASALSYAGLTAWSALRTGGLQLKNHNICGPRVLVTGVTGAVGHIAAQLARLWGASHLTVTCPPRQNLQDIKLTLQADEIIASPDEPYSSQRFDLIIDCVKPISHFLQTDKFTWKQLAENLQNIKTCQFPLVKYLSTDSRSRYVSLNPSFLPYTDQSGMLIGTTTAASLLLLYNWQTNNSFRWAFFEPNGDSLQTLVNLVAEGRLIVPIAKTFEFSQAKDAFVFLEQRGHYGKTVITLP